MYKRIAYLVSEYPAPSHSFIRREIVALRSRGVEILSISINKPSKYYTIGDDDKKELYITICIKSFNIFRIIKYCLNVFYMSPIKFIKSFIFSVHHRAPGVKNFIWSVFHFVEALLVAHIIIYNRINHIHSHFANTGAKVGLLASKITGIPWSLTLHGLADWTYPSGNLLPDKIANASFVACVSSYTKSQAYRVSSPEFWQKIFIVRCGLELKKIYKLKNENTNKKSRFRILNIGRLSPEKGQAGLINAFDKVTKNGLDAELYIVGDGILFESLNQLITKLGLQERCFLKGQITEPEVFDELQCADLFVLSSFMEGLPVVLMEAMSLKVPVLAPCIAGIPELVKPGETGFLFIAGDWDDLSKQIFEIAKDNTSALKFAENGFELINNEFDIDIVIAPLLKRFSAYNC